MKKFKLGFYDLGHPQNVELEQSVIRFVLGSLVVFIMVNIAPPCKWMVLGYIIFAGLSLLVTLHIKLFPRPLPLRIIAGQLIDMSAVSAVLYLRGEAGVIAYGVYLWVILGNGCRFGIKYLVSAVAIAVGFFLLAVWANPYWHQHGYILVGLLLALLFVPIYFSLLLQRLNAITKKYENISHHDELTGVLNRRALDGQLAAELARLQRLPGSRFGLAIVDIDHFKKVNDNYGHLVGDEVLKKVAEVIKNSCRAIDIIARYGGEEFVILLPGLENSEVENLSERLRSVIEENAITVNEHGIKVTVSIGIACWSDDFKNVDQWFQQADQSLYLAKNSGRNRVVSNYSIQQSAATNNALEFI